MTRAAVGFSNQHSPRSAVAEAVQAARAGLSTAEPSFWFCFATVGYEQEALLEAVREATNGAPLCGCSGEGVIAAEQADESNFALALLAVASDTVRWRTGFVPDLHADPARAGRAVARALAAEAGDDVRACFVFADGVHINMDGFVAGLDGSLAKRIPVVGGAAGDNWSLARTFQYVDGRVHSGGVAWAALSGPGRFDYTLSHGCMPVGGRRTITRIEGNRLYSVDDRPVLDVLGEYLSDDQKAAWDRALVNIALGVPAPSSFDDADDPYEYLITHVAPTARAAAEGYVTIPRELAAGTEMWIMLRDHDRIAEGNDRMMSHLVERAGGVDPAFVLHVDCASRGRACFRESQKHALLGRLRAPVGTTVPWAGFYSYGEFCPVGPTTCGHCYTAVLAAFFDEPAGAA